MKLQPILWSLAAAVAIFGLCWWGLPKLVVGMADLQDPAPMKLVETTTVSTVQPPPIPHTKEGEATPPQGGVDAAVRLAALERQVKALEKTSTISPARKENRPPRRPPVEREETVGGVCSYGIELNTARMTPVDSGRFQNELGGYILDIACKRDERRPQPSYWPAGREPEEQGCIPHKDFPRGRACWRIVPRQ